MSCPKDGCPKVKIHLTGLSGAGCIKAPAHLTVLQATSTFGDNLDAGSIAYLYAFCVDISCMPILSLSTDETVGVLANFIDDQFHANTYELNSASTTTGINDSNTKKQLAKMIAGCSIPCCSQ